MADFLQALNAATMLPERSVAPKQEFLTPADPKTLWRTAREQADYSRIDKHEFAGPASLATSGIPTLLERWTGPSLNRQPSQTDRYLRLIYKAMNYRIILTDGRVRVEPDPIYRRDDALTSADFFEYSDAQTFTFFCGLVRKRLSDSKVFQRVEVFVSLLSPNLVFGTTPPLLIANSGAEHPVKELQVAGATADTDEVPFEAASLIRQARELILSNEVSRGLDLLYKTVDDVLYAGLYSKLDGLLTEVEIDNSPIDFLLGLLTATLPVKTRLLDRPRFFASAKASIAARGQDKEGLFTGLE